MSDSPFLAPGKQFAWDSTSLGLLKECPRKYYYTLIEGWRSPHASVHLRFGLEYHAALEHFDKLRADGVEFEEAVARVVHELLVETWEHEQVEYEGTTGPQPGTGAPWSPDHTSKNRFTLLRSVIWYLDEFRNDAARTVILANGKPAVELSFKFEVDGGLLLCGHLDRLVDYQGGVYVMDRKTAGTTLTAHYFDQYTPDNQMSLYTIAGQVIFNSPIRGVLIDAAQIAVGFTRFARGVTYRTPSQLDEWLDAFYSYVKIAWGYAEADFWPMNDKNCHQYGGCVFRRVCSRDPSVRQQMLEADFVKREWNPLQVR